MFSHVLPLKAPLGRFSQLKVSAQKFCHVSKDKARNVVLVLKSKHKAIRESENERAKHVNLSTCISQVEHFSDE